MHRVKAQDCFNSLPHSIDLPKSHCTRLPKTAKTTGRAKQICLSSLIQALHHGQHIQVPTSIVHLQTLHCCLKSIHAPLVIARGELLITLPLTLRFRLMNMIFAGASTCIPLATLMCSPRKARYSNGHNARIHSTVILASHELVPFGIYSQKNPSKFSFTRARQLHAHIWGLRATSSHLGTQELFFCRHTQVQDMVSRRSPGIPFSEGAPNTLQVKPCNRLQPCSGQSSAFCQAQPDMLVKLLL